MTGQEPLDQWRALTAQEERNRRQADMIRDLEARLAAVTENRWADVDMAAWRAAVERADRLQVEVERLRVELDTTIARADDMHESMVRQRDEALAKVAAVEALAREREYDAHEGPLASRILAVLATEATS